MKNAPIDSLSAEGAANMEDTFIIIDKAKLEERIEQLQPADPSELTKSKRNELLRVIGMGKAFSLPAVQAAAEKYSTVIEDEGGVTVDGHQYKAFIACFQWIAEQSKKGK